jgi:PhnB protein
MRIPDQYLPLMPYLIVNNAKAFAEFVKTVFGATEQLIVPEGEDIMHGELRVYDAVIMFAGASDTWNEKTAGMYIYVPDVSDIYNLALENGAKSLMPPEEKDYGFTAGFEDPFGNHWWIVEAEKD